VPTNKEKNIMAYTKIADRNLKMIKVSFISKDISITQMVREDRIERFTNDILWKYQLNGKQYPHAIKTSY
jgi:hypothetical protein